MVSRILSRSILIILSMLIATGFPLAKNQRVKKANYLCAKRYKNRHFKASSRKVHTPSKLALTVLAPRNETTVRDKFIKLLGGVSDAVGTLHKGDKRKFKPAPVVIAELGVKLHKRFSTHISVVYRPKHKYSYKDSYMDIPEQHSIRDLSFSINGSFILYNGSFFEPYITVGGGIAINKSGNFTSGKLRRNTGFSSQKPYKAILLGKTNQSFVWRIGLGSEMKISENFRVDLVYLYSDLGKYITSDAMYKEGVPMQNTGYEITPPRQGKQKTHNILAGLAYWF